MNRPTPQQAGRDYDTETARRYGGKPQPGSGATDRYKLDWKVGSLLVENKTTTHESYRLTAAGLRKALAGAQGPGGRGEQMAMCIRMRGFDDDVFVIPGQTMRALLAGEVDVQAAPSKRAQRLAAARRA